jgi:hypothetical protein
VKLSVQRDCEDVQVIRITDSDLEFVEATGYRGEPMMER